MTNDATRAATRRHLNRAKNLFGSWRKLAQAFNAANSTDITSQAMNQWYVNGEITIDRAIQVERTTNGFVLRHELRPDLYAGYIQEVECANG